MSGLLLTSLGEIRKIGERHVSGVKQTRGGTTDLLRRADALTSLISRPPRRCAPFSAAAVVMGCF